MCPAKLDLERPVLLCFLSCRLAIGRRIAERRPFGCNAWVQVLMLRAIPGHASVMIAGRRRVLLLLPPQIAQG